MTRRPPRSTEERMVRAQKSMTPGTLGGRVASAAPMSLDVTRLDPRLRAQKRPGSTGAGFDPNADPVVIGQGAAANDTHSVSVGRQALVDPRYGVAVGYATEVDANYGVAVGSGAWAKGNGGISIGIGIAFGDSDICIGSGATGSRANESSGDNIAIGGDTMTGFGAAPVAHAIAIGSFAEADASSTIAIGNGAYSSNSEGVAVGYSAYSGADDGTAIGSQAVVTSAGPNGTALGYSSKAQHDHGVAIGYNARTLRDGNIMLGRDATGSQLHLSMNDDDAIYLYDPIDDVIRSVRINGGAWVIT